MKKNIIKLLGILPITLAPITVAASCNVDKTNEVKPNKPVEKNPSTDKETQPAQPKDTTKEPGKVDNNTPAPIIQPKEEKVYEYTPILEEQFRKDYSWDDEYIDSLKKVSNPFYVQDLTIRYNLDGWDSLINQEKSMNKRRKEQGLEELYPVKRREYNLNYLSNEYISQKKEFNERITKDKFDIFRDYLKEILYMIKLNLNGSSYYDAFQSMDVMYVNNGWILPKLAKALVEKQIPMIKGIEVKKVPTYENRRREQTEHSLIVSKEYIYQILSKIANEEDYVATQYEISVIKFYLIFERENVEKRRDEESARKHHPEEIQRLIKKTNKNFAEELITEETKNELLKKLEVLKTKDPIKDKEFVKNEFKYIEDELNAWKYI
ncbi:Uncharacterised protein [Mycoplasmopsis maculosa]|uniref:Lipoprotein n=1 Tax=Mycoplasmopsis maculosa TaxID=114885 RepID=A0A449B3Q5_9BACT|nr:hypothetical protein [Mycoplasmopsis maculosa]VEU75233.1 Uncharacterised protein [Mycoplasmopsis maculosa]